LITLLELIGPHTFMQIREAVKDNLNLSETVVKSAFDVVQDKGRINNALDAIKNAGAALPDEGVQSRNLLLAKLHGRTDDLDQIGTIRPLRY
jgi:hypothetical protein